MSFDIYTVVFPNNKLYIGVTSEGIAKRRTRHYYDVTCGSKTKFHNALRKYSREEKWIKVETVEDLELAYFLEIFFISEFNTTKDGYNITLGGEGRYGAKASKETRQKQRMAKLGKKAPYRNKKWRENISKSKLGSKNPTTKLQKEDVDIIIDLRNSGFWLKDIGALYGMAESSISNIVRGKRWNG